MARFVRLFFRLETLQRHLLLVSALMVGVVRAALWVFPYRLVVRALERTVPRRRVSSAQASPRTFARYTLWAVAAVSQRVLGKKPCLTQALVARWILACGGIPTDLKIGVTFGDSGQLLAHAWLEKEGRVLIGGVHSPRTYRPLMPVGGQPA